MNKQTGFHLTRRSALTLSLAGLAGAALPLALRPAAATTAPLDALAALERREGGRLGVQILDTGTGQAISHRADERFAMCSTFKFLVSALILVRVDAGEEQLDRAIAVTKDDMISHAPVTEKHVGQEMTVDELCAATMITSDNPAANLLLNTFGGPPAITAFARSLGDGVTRLDRYEPKMNLVGPGDERDTTSPAAMAGLMQQIVLGDVLSALSRERITGWLRSATTGSTRLRASIPADWNAGDKTGTGEDGPTNDIAVAWPPGRAPLVVTAYYDRTGRTMKENATILAEVGRIAVASVG